MMPDDTVYLQHILDAIQKIDMYLAGIDEPSFYAHSLIQDGVIRQLEIIGEAAKRILPATRSSAPHIPWLAIAGCATNSFTIILGLTSSKCGSLS